MPSHILTTSVIGLDAHPVHVEADISGGLPNFLIVGLPDTAVQEAKERVRSALKHAGCDFPRTRVTVNLAPADLKKAGTSFDLPIALAILMAQGDLPRPTHDTALFAGELGLDGTVRAVHGVLSISLLAKECGWLDVFIPRDNASEASLIEGVRVRAAVTLRDVIQHLRGQTKIPVEPYHSFSATHPAQVNNFSAIRGQEQARRALEIAAAGGHNLLMQGPPGSGKTLLARTFPSILPLLATNEVLELTRIYSVAGLLPNNGICLSRPFRAPHHSASIPSLVGGGTLPRPGEISLAHRGVLFLDEFLEFPRPALESLRQPLEDGRVTINRAQGTLQFPARFILIAACNPCPCGYRTDPEHICTCSASVMQNYRKRLSGPLLDRLDLTIEVPKVKTPELINVHDAEDSEHIRDRVQRARERQINRYQSLHINTNAELTSDQVRRLLKLDNAAHSLAKRAIERHHLSARAYFRLIKVSQTIADLASSDTIQATHFAEALQYRHLVSP